ncbi:jg20106, partial [Pararge aegeria aegeria]
SDTTPVEASTYTPAPDVEPRRRRPKHVLYDHDDQITTDNGSQQHTHTQQTQRRRRRRRTPRFLTIRTRTLTTGAFGLNNDYSKSPPTVRLTSNRAEVRVLAGGTPGRRLQL